MTRYRIACLLSSMACMFVFQTADRKDLVTGAFLLSIIMGLLCVLGGRRGYTFEDMGFQPHEGIFSTQEVSFVGITCVNMALFTILSSYIVAYTFTPEQAEATEAAQAALDYWGVLYAAVIGPMLEEVLFRGILLTLLAHWLGPKRLEWAIVASALVFSVAHFRVPTATVYAFFFGVLAGYAFLRKRSLVIPLGMHMAHNSGVELGRMLA